MKSETSIIEWRESYGYNDFVYININGFLGSIGGLIFYKLSYKFLLPKNISYMLGGVVSLLLSYQVVIFLMVQELLFGVLIALIVYIIFVAISQKHSE